MTSSAVTLCAFGFSAAVHAALLLAPMRHPSTSRSAGDDVISVDVLADPEPLPDSPEPAVIVPTPSAMGPAHAEPNSVPPDHDWTPRDPTPAHLALPATPHAPAAAAPTETADDGMPRFTIAIGTGEVDAHGPVSPSGVAGSRGPPAVLFGEQEVDGLARLVRGVVPAYPASARAEGIEGEVRLELVVGLSGAVESARVVRGVGHGLDEAALRAAQQFHFAPATRAGAAARVRMGWSVEFRLQ
jgi:periplasmic protein TonB